MSSNIERWSGNVLDKTDAEKIKHYDAMREQNRLHMVWYGELQDKIKKLELQVEGLRATHQALRRRAEEVASTMEGYQGEEVAYPKKLHRYAQQLREGL